MSHDGSSHSEVERYLTELGITARSFPIKGEDGREVTFRGERKKLKGLVKDLGERQSPIRGYRVGSTDLPNCSALIRSALDLIRADLVCWANRRRSFRQRNSRVGTYFSFAYSSLAVLRIGTSGSASFQIAKKS